nr:MULTISPECIES: hypothetical protein [Vagococcus]
MIPSDEASKIITKQVVKFKNNDQMMSNLISPPPIPSGINLVNMRKKNKIKKGVDKLWIEKE